MFLNSLQFLWLLLLVQGEFRVSERYITMSDLTAALEESRVKEMFGAGTACVVCPISKILYKGKVRTCLFFLPLSFFLLNFITINCNWSQNQGRQKRWTAWKDEQCQYVVSQVSYWLSEGNFSSCLLVFFLIAENIKSQVLGKWKKKPVPSSFANVEKYILLHFFYSVLFAKVPGKGEEKKDFHRKPNFWATAVLPSQVPLVFTPHCRDPSCDGRAVSRQCTAAFTIWEISPAQVEFPRHSDLVLSSQHKVSSED